MKENHNVTDLALTIPILRRTNSLIRTGKKITRRLLTNSPFRLQEVENPIPPTNQSPHNPTSKIPHTEANQPTEVDSKVRINDYLPSPVGGRLLKFKAAWKGAHFESTVCKGLSWSWEKSPPLAQKVQYTPK